MLKKYLLRSLYKTIERLSPRYLQSWRHLEYLAGICMIVDMSTVLAHQLDTWMRLRLSLRQSKLMSNLWCSVATNHTDTLMIDVNTVRIKTVGFEDC